MEGQNSKRNFLHQNISLGKFKQENQKILLHLKKNLLEIINDDFGSVRAYKNLIINFH